MTERGAPSGWSPRSLAPLLLPEPSRRLVVVGRELDLPASLLADWDEVIPLEPGADFRVAGAPDAVLWLDRRACAAQAELAARAPLAALARGAPPRAVRGEALVRVALPIAGRPLLWHPPGGEPPEPRDVSPRGRLDRPWLAAQPALSPLRRLGLGTWLAADAKHSTLAGLLDAAQVRAATWQQTGTQALIAMGAERVVKIPLRRLAPGALAAEHERLRELRASARGTPVEAAFPGEPRELVAAGWVAQVEPRLPGRSAFRWLGRGAELRRIQRAGAAFLEAWYAPVWGAAPLDAARFASLWEEPLRPLAAALAEAGEAELARRLWARMRERVLGRELPDVPQHGDFWLNNLLVDPESLDVTGVVDWDRARAQGLPLLDLLHLLLFRTSLWRPDLTRARLAALLSRRAGPEWALLAEHAAATGVDPSLLPDLLCRYWLGEIAHRVDEFFPGRRAQPSLALLQELLDSTPDPRAA